MMRIGSLRRAMCVVLTVTLLGMLVPCALSEPVSAETSADASGLDDVQRNSIAMLILISN